MRMVDVPVPDPVRLVPRPAAPERAPTKPDRSTDVDVLIFDPDWYLATYSDVATRRVDPVRHYLDHGADEGRDPNRHFSTTGYLDRNPDVRQAGLNPFLHFLFYGFREGRTWTPSDAATPAPREPGREGGAGARPEPKRRRVAAAARSRVPPPRRRFGRADRAGGCRRR